MQSTKWFDDLKNREFKNIAIIGKGPSIDNVDLSVLKNSVVINTNDTELVYPGDVCVFHHDWVLDTFADRPPQCNLYISDKEVPGATEFVLAKYVPNNPETADFLLSRFFSDEIFIEQTILVSALKVANTIAKHLSRRINVFMLGFDFTTREGYTKKIQSAAEHNDREYQEKNVVAHEDSLLLLLNQQKSLDIKINHVGNKSYSFYPVEAFNRIFGAGSSTSPTVLSDPPADDPDRVMVVAEITTNHFGDMDRLRSMIYACKESGADYVKLQKRDVLSFYSEDELNSRYASPFGSTFRDYRLGIELQEEQFAEVERICKSVDIGWFASVLDLPSFEFILQYDPEFVKLPSTISEHTDLLEAVANNFKKDVVISTGFTGPEYETYVLNSFKQCRRIFLLQCTSSYPTLQEDCQIGVVRHYHGLSRQHPHIVPGFSSHDLGSLCSMMAVAAGARMIEKHVKLGAVGWSHFDEVAVDLLNGDFKRFVADIRKAEKVVGSETKTRKESEHHKYWRTTSRS